MTFHRKILGPRCATTYYSTYKFSPCCASFIKRVHSTNHILALNIIKATYSYCIFTTGVNVQSLVWCCSLQSGKATKLLLWKCNITQFSSVIDNNDQAFSYLQCYCILKDACMFESACPTSRHTGTHLKRKVIAGVS